MDVFANKQLFERRRSPACLIIIQVFAMLKFFFSLDVTKMFLIGEPDVVRSLYLFARCRRYSSPSNRTSNKGRYSSISKKFTADRVVQSSL